MHVSLRTDGLGGFIFTSKFLVNKVQHLLSLAGLKRVLVHFAVIDLLISLRMNWIFFFGFFCQLIFGNRFSEINCSRISLLRDVGFFRLFSIRRSLCLLLAVLLRESSSFTERIQGDLSDRCLKDLLLVGLAHSNI